MMNLALVILIAAIGQVDTDIIISGGLVHDGSGAPAKRGDIGIKGDRIVAIGEFKSIDTDTAVYSLVSVIFFISMWKHSLSACVDHSMFNPETFLQSHVQALMHGWLKT